MPMYHCQLIGTFARSPELIKATRDFDRGRCTKEKLEKIRREDVSRLVEYQRDFEYITDGRLLWQDLLRPFMIANHIEEGPLTRFFKTNTFYRKPIIRDKIEFEPNLIENFFYLDLIPARIKVSLPGPISFLSLSEDRYGKDAPLMVAEVLGRASEHLQNKGVASIQFLEPGINPTVDFGLWRQVYEIITKNLSIETSIHTYFTDFSKILEIVEFPVNCVGIDFIYTALDDLNFRTHKKIGIGYIDAQNSLMEEVEEVVDFVKLVTRKLELKNFSLSTNCDLDFLPYSVAINKLRVLERAAKALKEG